MPVPEYECRCGRIYGIEQYQKDPYCPECRNRLWPKYISKPKPIPIEPIDPPVEVNLMTIFAEFNRIVNFDIGEGENIESASIWLARRQRAYADFRNRLSLGRLVSYEKLCEDYRQFLYFENNRSWTNLYRKGLDALKVPESLWKLVTYIQDESIPIIERTTETIDEQGKYHISGVGRNIVTGLLHVFYPDKYGVWNNRTEETLDLIRRKPVVISGTGRRYLATNNELKKLAAELDTDLTTVDGLMWFISKRLKSKLKG